MPAPSDSVNQSTSSISKNQPTQPIRKVLVFCIVALALLMSTIDSTIVATALHTMQIELQTSLNWAGWILTAYAFGFVLMLPISGKLSVKYGHRSVFLSSISLFTLASLCCGLTSNIYILIVLRVIQAVGGAGITPSVTGIIVDHFGSSRDRAVSLFGSIFPVGAMLGPIFGGLFVTYFTWRWIFFVNIPIGIAVVILGYTYVPKDLVKKAAQRKKMDFIGVLLLGMGVLAGMFAASYIGEEHTSVFSLSFIGLIILSMIGFIGFIRHIKQIKNPLIEPRLIYGHGFGAVNFINVLYGGVAIGVISLIPVYAGNRYGINELDAGMLLVAEGMASVVMSTVMTMLLRRTGYRPPLYVGCVFLIIGAFLISTPPMLGLTPYLWLAITTGLIGIGIGTINPSCRNAGLQLAPQQSSTIAALRSMGIQFGGIITIAIATAVIADARIASAAQAGFYLAVALIFIAALPVISRIVEHKGSW